MLHPDADVSTITPFIPEKVVKINNVRKPFTRWRFYEELEAYRILMDFLIGSVVGKPVHKRIVGEDCSRRHENWSPSFEYS